MDISADTKTDRLGRRTGPRRKYPLEDKLRILQQTRRPGASVADVARANGINANVVFGWRRLAKRGLLRAPDPSSAQLLPVKVQLLSGPVAPRYEAVRDRVRRPPTVRGVRFLDITAPDLALYDRLLGSSGEAVRERA